MRAAVHRAHDRYGVRHMASVDAPAKRLRPGLGAERGTERRNGRRVMAEDLLAGQRGDSFHCHRSGPVHYFFNHLRWGRGCTVMSTA